MKRFRRSLRIFQNNTKDDHSYTKGRQPPQRLQPRFRQLSDNIPRHYFPLCTAAQKSMITRLGTAIPLYQGLVRRFGYKARTPIKTQIVSLSAFLFGGGEGSRTLIEPFSPFHGKNLCALCTNGLRVFHFTRVTPFSPLKTGVNGGQYLPNIYQTTVSTPLLGSVSLWNLAVLLYSKGTFCKQLIEVAAARLVLQIHGTFQRKNLKIIK